MAAKMSPAALYLLRKPAIRALILAIQEHKSAAVKVLVERLGWSVDALPGQAPAPAPLIVAVQHFTDDQPESISILSTLVSAGADITVQDHSGASVLFYCKSLRALQVFISGPGSTAALQAVVNARLPDGRAALHFAAAGNRAGVVDELIGTLGAEIDLPGPRGATPLVLAVVHNAVASARALVEKGADIHVKAPDGRTLLELAREHAGDKIAALVKTDGDAA